MSHDHSHNHDHYDGETPHDHNHDHSDDITPALQNLLYQQIDFSAVTCLNEAAPRSAATLLQKTWQQRLEDAPELRSDVDEQLLLTVPFTGQVRLHSLLIRTSTHASAPRTLALHINQPDLDFATAAERAPTQQLSLAQSNDVIEYPVKRALFNSTRSLALFVGENWGGGEEEVTRIGYLGFKGEWMRLNKEPVSFLYEAAANPRDHTLAAGVKGGVGSTIHGAGGGSGF